MSKKNIIRAWKDADYRASLSEAERAMLPENPAGTVELAPAELNEVQGGYTEALQMKTYVCVWCVSQRLHDGWNIGIQG